MKKRPKVLLVDDDKDMCESLSDVLTLDSEYSVSYTTNPFNALEMIKKDDFALIIVDFKMPKLNGLDLLKKIKEEKKEPVIFMLTAFISHELIEQAKKAGAAKVLSKFIWPDDILKHIKEVLK